MAYLSDTGLTYLWGKIKSLFGSSLSVSGTTVTLKSKSGTTLSSIDTQDTTYDNASSTKSGLMSISDKSKLDGITEGATKNSITTTTVDLTVTGWSNKNQVVNVIGVTTSNLIIVSISNNSYGIECTAQSSGTLTFRCNSLPTTNVSVSVAILN